MYVAGFSQIEITPKNSTYLAGYAARWGKKSVGVHDPLYAKAFYIEQEELNAALISLDLMAVTGSFVESVRTKAKAQLGIENIIISCTHTHSGPHTYPQVQLDHEELDVEWLKWMEDQLIYALGLAVQAKTEVKIGIGSIDVSDVAKNRRKNKHVIDPELCIIKVEDIDGNINGMILNYACHATVLDAGNLLISADYPGYIYEIIAEKYPDAVTLFTNGAAGDINIGYSADSSALGLKMDIRTFENARMKAQSICERGLEVIEKIPAIAEGKLKYNRKNLLLPLKSDLMEMPEVDARIQILNEKIRNEQDDEKRTGLEIERIYMMCLKSTIFNNVSESWKNVKTESALLAIGNILLVTVPGELFCEIGFKIKKELFPDFETVVIGFANGYIGYIPTREALEKGGYESATSIFSNDVADSLVEGISAIDAG